VTIQLPGMTRFQMKRSVCHSNGSDVVADVFEVWSAKGFRFGSHHGDFHFGSSGCTFQFMRLLFPFIFETFQTFGVGVMFRH